MRKLIPLPARDPGQPHRAATQLEIFFDLVFVIAIASTTAALHHAISEGHGVEGDSPVPVRLSGDLVVLDEFHVVRQRL